MNNLDTCRNHFFVVMTAILLCKGDKVLIQERCIVEDVASWVVYQGVFKDVQHSFKLVCFKWNCFPWNIAANLSYKFLKTYAYRAVDVVSGV